MSDKEKPTRSEAMTSQEKTAFSDSHEYRRTTHPTSIMTGKMSISLIVVAMLAILIVVVLIVPSKKSTPHTLMEITIEPSDVDNITYGLRLVNAAVCLNATQPVAGMLVGHQCAPVWTNSTGDYDGGCSASFESWNRQNFRLNVVGVVPHNLYTHVMLTFEPVLHVELVQTSSALKCGSLSSAGDTPNPQNTPIQMQSRHITIPLTTPVFAESHTKLVVNYAMNNLVRIENSTTIATHGMYVTGDNTTALIDMPGFIAGPSPTTQQNTVVYAGTISNATAYANECETTCEPLVSADIRIVYVPTIGRLVHIVPHDPQYDMTCTTRSCIPFKDITETSIDVQFGGFYYPFSTQTPV
jgi:hypothetical protein